jgi:hypothetical protein
MRKKRSARENTAVMAEAMRRRPISFPPPVRGVSHSSQIHWQHASPTLILSTICLLFNVLATSRLPVFSTGSQNNFPMFRIFISFSFIFYCKFPNIFPKLQLARDYFLTNNKQSDKFLLKHLYRLLEPKTINYSHHKNPVKIWL